MIFSSSIFAGSAVLTTFLSVHRITQSTTDSGPGECCPIRQRCSRTVKCGCSPAGVMVARCELCIEKHETPPYPPANLALNETFPFPGPHRQRFPVDALLLSTESGHTQTLSHLYTCQKRRKRRRTGNLFTLIEAPSMAQDASARSRLCYTGRGQDLQTAKPAEDDNPRETRSSAGSTAAPRWYVVRRNPQRGAT